MKRTIGQALRDVGQEVALQLVAGHGDARRLELAGMDTEGEPLECVDTDRRARSGLSIKRDTDACRASKLSREVVEMALVHVIDPFGVLLYSVRSPCPTRSRST